LARGRSLPSFGALTGYIESVGRTWQRILAVGLAFVVAITFTFVFAFRAGRRARHMRGENEPIQEWMSVPFIAHSHHVPAATLFQAIGVQPRLPHDRRSVRRLASDLKRPAPELMAQLQRALDDAAHRPPRP
jgi:hypothetical protein